MFTRAAVHCFEHLRHLSIAGGYCDVSNMSALHYALRLPVLHTLELLDFTESTFHEHDDRRLGMSSLQEIKILNGRLHLETLKAFLECIKSLKRLELRYPKQTEQTTGTSACVGGEFPELLESIMCQAGSLESLKINAMENRWPASANWWLRKHYDPEEEEDGLAPLRYFQALEELEIPECAFDFSLQATDTHTHERTELISEILPPALETLVISATEDTWRARGALGSLAEEISRRCPHLYSIVLLHTHPWGRRSSWVPYSADKKMTESMMEDFEETTDALAQHGITYSEDVDEGTWLFLEAQRREIERREGGIKKFVASLQAEMENDIADGVDVVVC